MSNKRHADFFFHPFFFTIPIHKTSLKSCSFNFCEYFFSQARRFVSDGNSSGKRTRSGGSSQIPDKPKYVHYCAPVLFLWYKFLVRVKKSKGHKQPETIRNTFRYLCFFTSLMTQILHFLQGVRCARNRCQNKMASMMLAVFPPSTVPLGGGTISRW